MRQEIRNGFSSKYCHALIVFFSVFVVVVVVVYVLFFLFCFVFVFVFQQ